MSDHPHIGTTRLPVCRGCGSGGFHTDDCPILRSTREERRAELIRALGGQPPPGHNAIDVPLRCGMCDQIVGTATVQWDGVETAEVVATGDSHVDAHLADCGIGNALRRDVTRGISIDMDEL